MSLQGYPNPRLSLRKIILYQTGQDLRQCRGCAFCDSLLGPDMDISVESLVVLINMNDEEVLTSHTLWSDRVLESANSACSGNIDLKSVMMALREEAIRRGLKG
jgi:heterodisulfide reductase subunit C